MTLCPAVKMAWASSRPRPLEQPVMKIAWSEKRENEVIIRAWIERKSNRHCSSTLYTHS